METKKRTGANDACRTNDSIPKIGEVVHQNLTDAITEREYLLNHPKPEHGWSSGIGNLIEQRITCLNTMIADLVTAERKRKQ